MEHVVPGTARDDAPRPHRLLRLGLQRLARRLLSGRLPAVALAGVVCRAVPDGRAEHDLLPPRETGGGREMGRADAGGLPLRGEGEPLPDAHEAADRPRPRRRALLRLDRSAGLLGQARPGDLAAAGELPPRRRAAGGCPARGRRAAAGAARLRVPPRLVVRAGGRGAAARARRRARDRRPPETAVPVACPHRRLHADPLSLGPQRPARQLLRGRAGDVGAAAARSGAGRPRSSPTSTTTGRASRRATPRGWRPCWRELGRPSVGDRGDARRAPTRPLRSDVRRRAPRRSSSPPDSPTDQLQ